MIFRRRPLKIFLLGLLLSLLGALAWSFNVEYSQNILARNQTWLPYCPTPAGIRFDCLHKFLSRRIIAGGEFRPGFIHRHYHLRSRNEYVIEDFSVMAQMERLSTVSLGIITEGEIIGFRFSAHPVYPSAFFIANHDDSIREITPVDHKLNFAESKLAIRQEGDELQFLVNDEVIFSTLKKLPKGYLSLKNFQSTIRNASVTPGGELSFLTPFQITRGFWVLFVVFLLLSLLSPKIPLFLMLSGVLWGTYDFYYYSKKNFFFNPWNWRLEAIPGTVQIDFESLRSPIFREAFRLLNGIPSKNIEIENKNFINTIIPLKLCQKGQCQKLNPLELKFDGSEKLRILHLGGSLSGGWGTTSPEKTYPGRLSGKLESSFPGVEVASIAEFHSNAFPLTTKSLQELVERYRPRLIIFEFFYGNFDRDLLNKVIELTLPGKRDVMVFYGPSDIPGTQPELIPDVNKVKKDPLAKERAIYFPHDQDIINLVKNHRAHFVDANFHFLRPEIFLRDNYFADRGHLTDIGHEELTNYLVPRIISVLKP